VRIDCVISSSMLTALIGGLFIKSCHSLGTYLFYFMFFRTNLVVLEAYYKVIYLCLFFIFIFIFIFACNHPFPVSVFREQNYF
jgi:hypothetical protein